MKKNSTKGYVILGILFALVSIIAFAVPTVKTAAFWITYVFTAAAFAAQIVIWKTALGKGETLKSKFLGFPVVHIGIVYTVIQTSVYKGYKQDKIEMRGDRAEMSDFPLYLNMVAGGLDRRDQTIGGFSFVVKIYAVPVVEIIG